MGRIWGLLLILSSMALGHNPATQTSRLIGRITDQHGCPLPGVAVQALTPKGQVLVKADTAEDGTFILAGLPLGVTEIVAELKGFVRSEGRLHVTGPVDVWDTSLALGQLSPMPVHRVFGVVTAIEGPPIPAATISVVTVFGAKLVRQVRTDSKGAFSIELDEGGRYMLVAAQVGFGGAIQQIVISGPPAQHELNFRLSKDDVCAQPGH